MAIAFNLPSDEDTDARYETLNRILLELCELLRSFMTAPGEPTLVPRAGRPVSESSLPRMPDLLLPPRRRVCSVQTPPGSPSCSFQHLSRTFSEVFEHQDRQPLAYLDDEVFCTGLPVARSSLPPRQRRRRRRSSSFRETKRKGSRAKAEDFNPIESVCADRERREKTDEKDDTDPPAPIVLDKGKEGGSLLSALVSTKLGGSLWTAVVIVVGWKLLNR